MARRLVRPRAVSLGVAALLFFQTANQAPIATAASRTDSPADVQAGPAAAISRNSIPLAIPRPPAPITTGDSGGGFVPNGGVGTRVTPGRAQPPSKATELTTLRTETGDVTANADGTFDSVVSSGRVNFKDSAGAWQPIDVSLVKDATDGYDLRTKANDVTVRINDAAGAAQLAALTAGTYTIKLRVLGTTAGTVAPANDRVAFAGAPGTGTFAVVPTPEGVEFSVTFATANDANTYRVVLDTGGLTASLASDGMTVLLSDTTGTPVGRISPPTILDATGNAAPAAAVAVAIADPGVGATLRDDGSVVGADPTQDPFASPSASPGPSASALPSSEPVPVLVPAPSSDVNPSADPSSGPSPSPSADTSTKPSIEPSPSASPDAPPITSPPASPAPGTDPPRENPPNTVRANEVVLAYTIDPAWLADPTRAFPVTLDPTACIRFGGGTNCDIDINATNSNYGEGYTESNFPNTSPTGTIDQVGTDPTNGRQHALIYFGHATLPDGAIVTDADLRFNQPYGYTGGQVIRTAAVGSAWSHSTIDWNNEPGTTGSFVPDTNALTSNGTLHIDVTSIVQARYSRSPLDWKIDYGFWMRLANDATSCANSTLSCWRIYMSSASDASASNRPLLVIHYYVPQVSINFDASLGADFVPSTMPAGGTVNLPVTVTNNGSAQTFNKVTGGSTDYYQLGYRWFDNKGKYATGFTSSGTVDLPADIPPTGVTSTSATISLPVGAPPTAGQYGLRLDLVHVFNGTKLWASDWAKPSKYYSRNKDPLATPSTTRWVGSSVVKRADFPIAVVSGGGTATGETKSVSLADGSSLGVNTWSHNLTYTGQGGVGFNDLGTSVGVAYGYNSAERADCTGVLGACGWWTNYDEGFTWAASGADYIYRDGSGNKSFINSNGDGQLTGGPSQIDRPRVTLWDENTLAGWTNTAPTMGTTGYSGSHSLQISTSTGVTTTTAFHKVDIGAYPLVSFAVDGTATGGAVGFYVTDLTTGNASWLYYTVGTDFTILAYPKVALGGTFTSSMWRSVLQQNIHADAVTKGIAASSYDAMEIGEVALRGPSGNATLRFDDLRFEGRTSGQLRDVLPTWSANGSKATLNSTDVHSGAASIQVTAAGVTTAPTHTQTLDISTYAYESWAWKSVGGTVLGMVFKLADVRDGTKTGTIVYYAGPTAPAGAPNCPGTSVPCVVQVAATVPTEWTVVTRNVLEDGRQLLGFYNDADTSGSESAPGGGPTPDLVSLTDYALVAPDGSYGLFDDLFLETLPNNGDQWGAATGDDFLITYRGGAQHRFNADGKLVKLEDADNNATTVVWTYSYTTRAYTLTTIQAPSDGQAVAGGTAQREIAVTVPSGTSVRFTESLGTTGSATGRYTEFQRTATDLTTVVPARWDAACGTGASPSGCLLFGYTGSHLLQTVTDPRKTSGNTFTTTVGWTGTDPMSIRADATATDQLRILSWNAGSTWRTRPEYEDADGIATGTNGFARYDDLTPNGSVLAEYVPLPCTASACVGGTTTPTTPTDMLVSYTQDGADNYSTEIHYRLPANAPAGQIVSRRGTYAAAKVDNYADAITGGLTAWSQTPEQYAQSMAVSGNTNPDLYRTTFSYNALGLQTHATTPYTNPVGTNNVAVQDVITVYDGEGHPIEVSDKGFVTNRGFESALLGWTGTGLTSDASAPNSGKLSAKLTGNASLAPVADPELLPGQTFRFQAALKATAGTTITYSVRYQKADGSWSSTYLVGPTPDTVTSWHPVSFDVTIPLDANGVVEPTFTTPSGSANVDDVVIFTSFGATGYRTNGLVDSHTDVLSHVTQLDYLAGATYPAIFATSSTANYASGQPLTADQNVTSATTYDAWGRTLVATDPDGVATTKAYDANLTDVSSSTDGVGNAARFPSYDAIGEPLTALDPLDGSTTTTYSSFGDPVDVTAPDTTVIHNEYDGVGRLTAVTSNYVNGGGGTSGVANVKATRAYNEYGKVTRDIADVGVIAATTDTTYDLVGTVVSSTVYPDGTSNPRTTTTYFDAAGTAAGTAGPIVPTSGPACPGAPSSFCNSVSTIDLAGRTIATTDAYGKIALTWADFSGKPVMQIGNYVAGGGSTADQNVTSTMRYDPADHVVAATDALGRVSSTVYDNLDRVTKIVKADGSWARTDYTAGGRIDRSSRPGSSAQVDADVAWTKKVYDAAGRLVTDLSRYDTSGVAQDQFDGFEGGVDTNRWLTTTDTFLTQSASIQADTAYSSTVAPENGAGRLHIGTSGTAGQGIRWDVSHRGDFQLGKVGSYTGFTYTFKYNHTYTLTADVLNTVAATIAINLGTVADHPPTPVSTVLTPNVWTRVSVSWTPSADRTSGVEAVFTNPNATSTNYKIDDVWVSDNASTDRNIPTTTVFDRNSRVIESIVPPGVVPVPGSAATTNLPFVTGTAYDPLARPVMVVVATTQTYPATVKSDSYQGYWPLDEAAGATIDDTNSPTDLTLTGGTLHGVAGAIDEARTATWFDGLTGAASRPSAKSTVTDNFTLESWFRADAFPTSGTYALIAYNGTDAGGWGFGIDSGGQVVARYGGVAWLASGMTVSLGAYHHVALVRNTGTATIYVDGTPFTPTNAASIPLTPGAGFAIGRQDSTVGRYFAGRIDDVALYSTALSAARISAHYTAGRATAADVNLATRSVYDAVGDKTDSIDPTGVVTHFEFDRRGSTTATIQNYLLGQGTTALVNVRSRFAYDDLNELLASCPAQRVQADSCDPTVPSISAWRQTYDAAGHAIDTIPPVNATAAPLVTTTAVYDTASGGLRLTRSCDHPAGASSCTGATRYTDYLYDNVGRVTRSTTYLGTPSGAEKLRTVTTYDAAGQRTALDYTENAAGSPTDALTFGFDLLGRETTVTRGSPITTTVYNADDSVATRKDHVISSTAAGFGYDTWGNLTTVTSPLYTGSATFSWRLDALIAGRTWPGTTNAAMFTYDGAKRPTQFAETVSGAAQATMARAYDRNGSVASETQTIPTVTGYAGNTAQTFGYDPLGRVSTSTLGTVTRAYAYDADSNRLSSTENGTTITALTYDRTDELKTQQVGGGTIRNVTYDVYGNATSVPNPDGTATFTTYSYDFNDRLKGLTPASGSGAVSYTIDAVGRHATRVGGTTDTYTYAGSGEAVVRIANATTTTDSVVDALGSRLASKTTTGSLGWLLPDLHGDIAAALSSTGAAVTDAFRYDAYGKIVAQATSALPTPWRYQGRLLESTGSDPALYDFGFRSYDPGLGAFTSLDDIAGQAQNPVTFNRFLYAAANPATLTDPDGHWPWDDAAAVLKNVVGFGKGVIEGAAETVVSTITGTVALAGAAVGAGGCAIDANCRDAAIKSIGSAVQDFAHDPIGNVVAAAGNGAKALGGAIGGAVDHLAEDWRTGDFEDLGKITGAVAVNFIPVGGIIAKAGAIGRGLADAAGATRLITDVAAGTRAGQQLTTIATRLESAWQDISPVACPIGRALGFSFTADTLVAVPGGLRPIGGLAVGDTVLAEDPVSGVVEPRPVTIVHLNDDPVSGVVVIAGEPIRTTPEHPFYSEERGWLPAGHLVPGEHVRSASGGSGLVSQVGFAAARQMMYNLTVADDHTYFVGRGAWLVHNCGGPHVDPRDVRFSQRGVSETFDDGRSLFDTADDLAAGLDPHKIEPIRVFRGKSGFVSIDNRRLKSFRMAGTSSVPVKIISRRAAAASGHVDYWKGFDEILIRGSGHTVF